MQDSIKTYMERSPLDTIRTIRNILNKIGILAVENAWHNSANNYYSVNLMIKNTNIYSNGRGTSHENALVSAYGELIERLQNLTHFRLGMDFSDEMLNYKGFFYAPDEVGMSKEEFIERNDEWTKIQIQKLPPKVDINELLSKWKDMSYEDTYEDFITLPYFNISNKKISHIPLKMVSKMYMSNGMGAGNSMEQALVSGITETIERYTNIQIIKNKLTPPTISKEYLKKYPKLLNMIYEIESKGNYEIIIKDCSLNEGFPVVSVTFIDKNSQNYSLRFGCHPIFELAVERTLTELLQGQDIQNMVGLKEFSYKDPLEDSYRNLMDILANGCGYYPSELFSDKYSYEFTEFKEPDVKNNKDMLDYLVKLLEDKGFNIFIRDVSFLGFPSFHVIIPGFSEIDKFDFMDELDNYKTYNKIKKYIRNVDKLNQKETKDLINFFTHSKYSSGASIVQYLNLPTKDTFPWYYLSIDLFMTALYLKNNDLKNAKNHLEKYTNYLKCVPNNQILLSYYKCAKDYLGTIIDELNEKETFNILKTFYPLNIINQVFVDFKNFPEIFNSQGQITCFNCEDCSLKPYCSYKEVENIYKILKDQYAVNKIDQNYLRNLF